MGVHEDRGYPPRTGRKEPRKHRYFDNKKEAKGVWRVVVCPKCQIGTATRTAKAHCRIHGEIIEKLVIKKGEV